MQISNIILDKRKLYGERIETHTRTRAHAHTRTRAHAPKKCMMAQTHTYTSIQAKKYMSVIIIWMNLATANSSIPYRPFLQ